AGVWSDVHAKSIRLGAPSDTDAAEAMYTSWRRGLDGYLAALPCRAGQCGSLVGISGEFVCLDLISRPDVYARLYTKLLRGYALDAIEAPSGEPLSDDAAEELLADVSTARRKPVPSGGRGVLRSLRSERLIAWELRQGEELLALAAFADGPDPPTNRD